MDDELEYDEDTFTGEMHRFRPIDAIVIGLDLLRGITVAVATTLTTAYNVAAAHANYQMDQEAFRREAALEIENMTGEGDG